MADQVDDLARAALRSWAQVARAWIQAANSVWASLVDLADVESGRTGFNQEVVVLPAQAAATALQPGQFADADGTALPGGAVTVEPAQAPAGAQVEVTVKVTPPPGVPSGTYAGCVTDATGAPCSSEIGIFVVGDRLP